MHQATHKIMGVPLCVIAGLSFFVFGCADDTPSVPSGNTNHGPLKIVFSWPGDDMADRQALEIRDRIAQRITSDGIGKILRAGTGMGWMDLVVDVEDKQAARRQIEQIVNDLWPGSRFSIQESGF